MEESIDVESGTEVVSSFGLSGGCVERKLEGYSRESERGASGARVEMVAGLLGLDTDAVAVAAAYTSAI